MTLPRAARLFVLATCSLAASAQSGSVPFLEQPLVPSAVKPGGTAFTLTVNGAGFQTESVVRFNGTALSTTYISSKRLTALVPASAIASPQTANITVSSGPKLLSNSAFLQVENAHPAIAFTSDSIPGIVPYGPFVVGDFNGDNRQDIVVDTDEGVFEVLLGEGNGKFQNPVEAFQLNGGINQFLTADLNGDGNLDLVVLSNSDARHSVTVLGNGDGTFQTPQVLPLGAVPVSSAAAGDFNGDGKLDLICSLREGATSLLLGNGDGTFTPAETVPSVSSANFLEAADLNGDGFLDVAAAAFDPGGISIFLNDGTGNMVPAGVLAGAGQYAPFVLADLNGDGIVDLASLDTSYTFVQVYLGIGNGAFQPPVSYPLGNLAEGVVAGDFHGDGKLDLIAPWQESSSAAFSLLTGNGDGTFQPPLVHAGPSTFGVIPADFNNDGQLDLATISDLGHRLSIFYQTSVLANPSGLTFPVTPVNRMSQPLPVTVSNIAAAPLSISALQLAGPAPGVFSLSADLCSGQTLAAGASCSFSVAFEPRAIGSAVALVTIPDNARVAPQTLVLQGGASEIGASPSALAFGAVKLDHASPGQVITIANTGAVADSLFALVQGADPQDFLLESTCPSSLLPGTSCSLFVRFIPTATGPRSATINVTDQTNEIMLPPVNLSGTGN